MGLPGMINSVVRELDVDLWEQQPVSADAVLGGDRAAVARAITGVELGRLPDADLDRHPRRGRAAGTSRSSASPAPAAPASPA